MMHTINGKKTVHGNIVHYTDQHGQVHAAIVTSVTPAQDDGYVANLHVFHDDGTTGFAKSVPFHAEGTPYTWNHLPTK